MDQAWPGDERVGPHDPPPPAQARRSGAASALTYGYDPSLVTMAGIRRLGDLGVRTARRRGTGPHD